MMERIESRNRDQNLNSKQIIIQAFNIISTNKSCKHFTQNSKTKKANSASNLSAQ